MPKNTSTWEGKVYDPLSVRTEILVVLSMIILQYLL